MRMGRRGLGRPASVRFDGCNGRGERTLLTRMST